VGAKDLEIGHSMDGVDTNSNLTTTQNFMPPRHIPPPLSPSKEPAAQTQLILSDDFVNHVRKREGA
jgi:hypothetical protein